MDDNETAADLQKSAAAISPVVQVFTG